MARPKANQGAALVEDKQEPTREPFVADLTNLTPEELAIAKRVAQDDDSWQTITEGDITDYSLAENPFKIPPPAEKAENEKRFAFRWITRDPKRLDEVKSYPVPRRWWICNRVNTPFLAQYVDPILGCVAKHDQMLVFKPWWMHEAERRMKDGLADALSNRTVAEKAKQDFEGGTRSSKTGKAMRAETRGDGDLITEESIEHLMGNNRPTVLTDDLIDTEPD